MTIEYPRSPLTLELRSPGGRSCLKGPAPSTSRVSFRVATRVDSRTVLDVMGAEHLLGKGDMLFLPPGSSRLTRVHGAFVTETGINRVVDSWKEQADPLVARRPPTYPTYMRRRTFLALTPLTASPTRSAQVRNKRERMLQWLAGKTDPNYTPAAFFLHFGPQYKDGSAAARRHLEFFRQTDMDFVKIQFEQTYDRQPFLQKPSDWAKLALRRIDFYEPLVQTVRELVKASRKDALVLMTLYSPFMCAGHCATAPLLKNHLEENPDAVKRGLEILTESQLIFVRACIQAGVDGFYMSTQGSETKQFSNPRIFTNYIKPADLVAMNEIQAACPFNILHVCDYNAPYATYDAVLDYPGHVVNCNTRLTNRQLSAGEISALFKRPYMGGLDRHGVLATGTPAQVEAEIERVIRSAPRQFILAADCTVAGDTPWPRLRHAISVAHRTGRS